MPHRERSETDFGRKLGGRGNFATSADFSSSVDLEDCYSNLVSSTLKFMIVQWTESLGLLQKSMLVLG